MEIGRYEIERELGEGSAGKVYLARDPKLGRRVALKVLADRATDEVRDRFRLEARAIAALDHPNIIQLHDYSDEDTDQLYLVMEFVPGRSLAEVIAEHGPMSEATALCVGHELLRAVEHAHKSKIVHRDIKPENLLLHEGRIVLTDFGAVKAVAADNPLQAESRVRTVVIGTPGFMAPEQFAGKSIDFRTDLFAVGATLYCLSTGEIPYRGGSVDEIYTNLRAGKYEQPTDHSQLLSADFCHLLADCLAPKAKDRIDSAGELRDRIRKLLETHGVVEIREELAAYEAQPAQAAVSQRERQVDALVKELKVALKDKEWALAKELMRRFQTMAPLDDRLKDVSGLSFDASHIRRVYSPDAYRAARRVAFAAGLVVGAVVTTAAFLALSR